MRPSEMALLRKELAKVVAENRNLQKKMCRQIVGLTPAQCAQ